MNEKKTDKELSKNFILNIYKESVKNLPILKYSWVLIATICILAFAGYFKLKNEDVFLYAFYVLVICFLAYVFSLLLKSRDKLIKIALYIFIYSLIVTMCLIVLSFAFFILSERPAFYKKWFPDQSMSVSPSPQISNDSIMEMPGKAQNVRTNKNQTADGFKTFKLLPSGNLSIEKLITKDGYIRAENNARYTIDIAFSGYIQEVSGNLYRYPGGYVIIRINGVDCLPLKDKIIPSTFFGGNNKAEVLREVNDQIEKLISVNQTEIFNHIETCLKK